MRHVDDVAIDARSEGQDRHEPKIVMDVLPFMFRRELKDMHLFLAIGEALAHLEYLVHAGRVRRELVAGRVTYTAL